ncbi:MAG: 50S ribosomal protein L17 [Candidatus Gastranaerophilales bacterium]|nr:50S ribosomal protein L17 [Candidatus Gastranaerophilales bacterium]
MRHQCNSNRLSRPKDQRDALLRSLATELFLHGEITTTISKAKALKPYAEEIITLAKRGDLHARRQAAKYIFDVETSNFVDNVTGEIFESEQEGKKLVPLTVLRKLFCEIGKQYENRNGGYTRIYHLPPRRGDAAEMAIIQLV